MHCVTVHMIVLRFIEDIRIHQRINPMISRCTTAFNEVEIIVLLI